MAKFLRDQYRITKREKNELEKSMWVTLHAFTGDNGLERAILTRELEIKASHYTRDDSRIEHDITMISVGPEE